MKADSDRLSSLRKRTATAPTEPGVYRWLDATGRILYVGKAKNLRNRLRSYVAKSKGDIGPWKQSFLEQIVDFDITVTGSDLEALVLETNLIKQLKPKYNVLMKDGKNYLFVRITVEDPYPRVETVRRFEQDGAKYFGPFLNGYELRETLDLLHMALKYRACRQSLDALNKKGEEGRASLKPCLEHQIGRCNGLCAGAVSADEYLRRIQEVIAFLNGHKDGVRAILEHQMRAAATDRKFEVAAKLRNYVQMIDGKTERQIATDTTGESSDIFGIAILSSRAHVVVMHQRDGRLIGEANFSLHGHAESVPSVLEQFLPQFYDDGQEVPEAILMPDAVEDMKTLKELLEERRGKSVKVIVPERGRKSHLLQLAEKNARVKAKQAELKWEAENKNLDSALKQLKKLLSLPSLPKRIEGYDISHLGGTETVGSMVVAKNGKAANAEYRSFTIRTLKAGEIDDYKAIREVLNRRLRHICGDIKEEEKKWNENGITFGKGLKKDQTEIERIHAENTDEMENNDIRYGDYVVARNDGSIIGFGRIFEHPKKILELKSIWVEEPYRGQRLGQCIARKLLRSVKKGKVYVTINPMLENYYVDLGFRYVHAGPAVFEERLDRYAQSGDPRGIIMMWETVQNKIDKSLTARPDLIVIDGGKGQLNAALEALQAWKIDIPTIGLAKREEEIFVPGNPDPIPFPPDSPSKFLLMRLRDEAHRFSNRHRETRLKRVSKESALDDVPGIGEETRSELLRKFGAISAIVAASDEELLTILTAKQLEEIRKHLA